MAKRRTKKKTSPMSIPKEFIRVPDIDVPTLVGPQLASETPLSPAVFQDPPPVLVVEEVPAPVVEEALVSLLVETPLTEDVPLPGPSPEEFAAMVESPNNSPAPLDPMTCTPEEAARAKQNQLSGSN